MKINSHPTLKQANAEGGQFHSINFWRFVFTILICALHFESPFLEISRGVVENRVFESAYLGVEFSFILSGALLAKSYCKSAMDTNISAPEFAMTWLLRKWKRMMPYILCTVVFVNIFFKTNPLKRIAGLFQKEWFFLFLSVTGFGEGDLTLFALWFVSSLMIAGYFLSFILAKFYETTVYFILPALVIFNYSFLGTQVGHLDDHLRVLGPVHMGTLRALAGLSLGILLFLFVRNTNRTFSKQKILCLNILELYSIYRIYSIVYNQPLGIQNFKILIYLSVIIVLSFLQVTYISSFLSKFATLPVIRIFFDRDILFCIYCVHAPLIKWFCRTVPISNMGISLTCFLLFCYVIAFMIKFITQTLSKQIKKLRSNRPTEQSTT